MGKTPYSALRHSEGTEESWLRTASELPPRHLDMLSAELQLAPSNVGRNTFCLRLRSVHRYRSPADQDSGVLQHLQAAGERGG